MNPRRRGRTRTPQAKPVLPRKPLSIGNHPGLSRIPIPETLVPLRRIVCAGVWGVVYAWCEDEVSGVSDCGLLLAGSGGVTPP